MLYRPRSKLQSPLGISNFSLSRVSQTCNSAVARIFKDPLAIISIGRRLNSDAQGTHSYSNIAWLSIERFEAYGWRSFVNQSCNQAPSEQSTTALSYSTHQAFLTSCSVAPRFKFCRYATENPQRKILFSNLQSYGANKLVDHQLSNLNNTCKLVVHHLPCGCGCGCGWCSSAFDLSFFKPRWGYGLKAWFASSVWCCGIPL